MENNYTEPVYAVVEGVIQECGVHPEFVAVLRQRVRAAHRPHPSTSRRGEPVEPSGRRWFHLPILCCRAAGGDPDQGIVVAAAFELARLAANVLDDVEDADGDGALWRSVGMPQATNVGTSLIFASLLTLSRLRECGATPTTVALIQAEFALTGFRMGAGQHLDLLLSTGARGQGGWGDGEMRRVHPSTSAPQPPCAEGPLHRYWQIVAAKSGAFFDLGCRAGALLSSPGEDGVAPYATYGRHLGLLIQITNDLAGLLDEHSSSDLARRKLTLPVIYALSVADETQREHLRRAWAEAAHDAQARRDARRMVIDLGAPHYISVEAERHYRRARQALEQTTGQPAILVQLIAFLDQYRPASLVPIEPALSSV